MDRHRVIVTGGAGFIGSHVAERLLLDGQYVTVIDNLSTGSITNVLTAHPRLSMIEADLLHDDPLAGLEADVLIHMAGRVNVGASWASPVEDVSVNLGTLLRVLTSARERGIRRVVFPSSGAIYGVPPRLPSEESDRIECQPSSPYGVAKKAAESYLGLFPELERTILVLSNVYGPRQTARDGAVIPSLREAMRRGEVRLSAGGRSTRDFVYVSDVAAAFAVAATSPVWGVFNISTGVETPILEVYEALRSLDGYDGPAALADGKPDRIALCPHLAHEVLGWHASTPLVAGLRRTVAGR